MSGMQGWPGAGPAPGPAQGSDGGRRLGILALVIVLTVACSFGLAKATGADTRDNGAMAAPGGLAGGIEGGLGEMELPELPDPSGLETPDPDVIGGAIGGADGGTGGSADGGTGSGGGGGGTSGADGGGAVVTPTPSPTPTLNDPTLESYQAVRAGDCLNNWMTGETTWVSDLPQAVSCDDDGAGVWVSLVSDSTSDCPVDAGRSYLSYTGADGTVVALCVTRQFEVGQCFLGESDNTANLMSWVDCEASSVPQPYSQIYNVTGVYSAPAQIQGTECRRSSTDQNSYYWWPIDGESIMLCAVIYSS